MSERNPPRRFVLRRSVDRNGISGTGDVAEGVEWSDGTVSLRWRSQWPSTTTFEHGLIALLRIHGHGGSTTVEWLDYPPAGAWDKHDDPTVEHP